MGLISNNEEAFEIYKDAVRLHYHSCQAVNYRCHKTTSQKEESYYRYPV